MPILAGAVLIGIPASGKTRLAQELVPKIRSLLPKCVVLRIVYDDLIPQPQPEKWRQQRQELLEAVFLLLQSCQKGTSEFCTNGSSCLRDQMHRILLENGVEFLDLCEADNVVAVFDDNMYYRSMRYEIYQKAQVAGAGFCQCYIGVDLNVALVRNARRGSTVSEDVIKKMNAQLEPPSPSQHRFETNSIVLSTPWSENDLNDIAICVLEALRNPVAVASSVEIALEAAKSEEARERTRRDVLHQADCILRSVVQQRCRTAREENQDLRVESVKFNFCRKMVLEALRMSDLQYFEMDLAALRRHIENEMIRAEARTAVDRLRSDF